MFEGDSANAPVWEESGQMMVPTLLQLTLNMETAALLCHHTRLCQTWRICED